MGNRVYKRNCSLKKLFANFRQEDWQQVVQPDSSQRDGIQGVYNTFKNKITGEEIDKYELVFSNQREKKIYEQCFLERLREDYLINAFHYVPIGHQSFCSSFFAAYVYIQHAPVRLSDITDIPIPQNLYILKCALLGFQKLYNSTGYFTVMEQHVCIDRQGHVRVWMNADLSKNYPQGYEEDSAHSRDSERIMVGQIFELIQKNTQIQNQGDLCSITEFIQSRENKYPSFRQAYQLLQIYIKENNIEVPNYCESVIEIFQEEHGINFDPSYSDLDEIEQYQQNNEASLYRQNKDDEPMVVHYEAPDPQAGNSLKNSQLNSHNAYNTPYVLINSNQHQQYTSYQNNYNYQSDFSKQKNSYQQNRQPANDDWKNQSLKSSLKFVDNQNSSMNQGDVMSRKSMNRPLEMNEIAWRQSSRRRESQKQLEFQRNSNKNYVRNENQTNINSIQLKGSHNGPIYRFSYSNSSQQGQRVPSRNSIQDCKMTQSIPGTHRNNFYPQYSPMIQSYNDKPYVQNSSPPHIYTGTPLYDSNQKQAPYHYSSNHQNRFQGIDNEIDEEILRDMMALYPIPN